jgi:hypothetical protein
VVIASDLFVGAPHGLEQKKANAGEHSKTALDLAACRENGALIPE